MISFRPKPTIDKTILVNFYRYSSTIINTTANNIDYSVFNVAPPNTMVADLLDTTNTLTGIAISNENQNYGNVGGIGGVLPGGEGIDSEDILSEIGLVPGSMWAAAMHRDFNDVVAQEPFEYIFSGLNGAKLYNFYVVSSYVGWTNGRVYAVQATAIGQTTIKSNEFSDEDVGQLPGIFLKCYGVEPDVSDEIMLQVGKVNPATGTWNIVCNGIIIQEVTP